MRLTGTGFAAAAAAMLLAFGATAQDFSVIHEFTAGAGYGTDPYTGVVRDGDVLYGVNTVGGASACGTVFKINTDGTGLQTLHSFAGAPDDGDTPYGQLLLDGGVLYGTTRTGGASDLGTIFKVNTDGTGYDILHEFAGGVGDGSKPDGGLIVDGGTLYGMTYQDGAFNAGTIFKISTAGGALTTIREFTGGVDDGGYPHGGLTLDGGTLYGMTSGGGDEGRGVLFAVSTGGGGYTNLHEFAGGVDDGSTPFGGLIFDNNVLYGVTKLGGDSEDGVVFSYQIGGAVFTLLHEFTGTVDDGAAPWGDLTMNGDVLYGATANGGDADSGTLFSINADGTGFQLLHEFGGGAGDGSNPLYGSVAFNGARGTFYGATAGGGATNGGVVYAVHFTHRIVHSFGMGADDGEYPQNGFLRDGDVLYGTTYQGGANNDGSIFKIGVDGDGYELLYSFGDTVGDGSQPYAGLILDGATLYGATYIGGSANRGTVFSIGTDGAGFTTIHSFAVAEGNYPRGGLVLEAGTLYGTTGAAGAASGTVFKVNTDSSGFTTLHSFTGDDGSQPYGGLVLYGGVLYGTTYDGGLFDLGTVFKVDVNGGNFSNMHDFAGQVAGDAANPRATLIRDGNTLYGTAYGGGFANFGAVFKIEADGTGFDTVHEFNLWPQGQRPECQLVLNGSTLYGTTNQGGSANNGTIFKVGTDGSGYTVMHSFSGGVSDGDEPRYGALCFNDSFNTYYGMSYRGGATNQGVVFTPAIRCSIVEYGAGRGMVRLDGTEGVAAVIVIAGNKAGSIETPVSDGEMEYDFNIPGGENFTVVAAMIDGSMLKLPVDPSAPSVRKSNSAIPPRKKRGTSIPN